MASDRSFLPRFALLAFAPCVVALGCGGLGGNSEMAPVSGVVTLDGDPVTSGYVFTSSPGGKMAKAKIGEDGSFQLGTNSSTDGAAIGEHTVMLAPIPPDEAPTPEWAVVPPDRYASAQTSGLVMSVPPEGLSDYVIALESGPEDKRKRSQRPPAYE